MIPKNQSKKIDKTNLYKVKSQNLPISQSTTNKENLKDLIMDFLIYKLFKQSQKDKTNKCTTTNHQTLKKIPIQLQFQWNGGSIKIQVNCHYILERYIQFEQKNVYKQNNIEPLLVEILSFFDEMQELLDSIHLDINQQKDLPEQVITILLEKYYNDKQRINRIRELDLIKGKTTPKYTRVDEIENKFDDFYDGSVNSSHRVSRDTLNLSIPDKDSTHSKEVKESKFKLKDLMKTCKVFQHPEKVQKLRQQKLKQIYDGPDIDNITQSTKKQFSTLVDSKNTNNQDQLQFLQNWITEISISEKLFQNKFQKKETKLKQNQLRVGKIIEESDDDEQNQNDTQQNL